MKRTFSFVLLWCCAGCRQHVVQDGQYRFSVTQSVRDDCGLQNNPDVITTGQLRTTGDVVRIDYAFFKIRLAGTYAVSTERMSLDGSAANVQQVVNGTSCLLDLVNMHIDATAVDPSDFTGQMAFSLQTPRPESCVCELWVLYSAHLEVPAP